MSSKTEGADCRGRVMKQMSPFTMSIEPVIGTSYQHGFHLGTQEKLARQICEERFTRGDCKTVGLKQDGKLIDMFYGNGEWHNAMLDAQDLAEYAKDKQT